LKDQTEDGKVDYHRLLASMMTGRSWGGVLDGTAVATEEEKLEVQKNLASNHFFKAV
jgi:hypothetical protein